jgi:exosome complex RNA-binding protein Csl4
MEAQCPRCRGRLEVGDDELVLRCPHCGARLERRPVNDPLGKTDRSRRGIPWPNSEKLSKTGY